MNVLSRPSDDAIICIRTMLSSAYRFIDLAAGADAPQIQYRVLKIFQASARLLIIRCSDIILLVFFVRIISKMTNPYYIAWTVSLK